VFRSHPKTPFDREIADFDAEPKPDEEAVFPAIRTTNPAKAQAKIRDCSRKGVLG
jgi:hypothetical protein